MKINRCHWATKNELLMHYHDNEWGVPVFNDQKLFEILTLEIFQAGLTWNLILKKRPFLTDSFCHFNIEQISRFDSEQVRLLMNNPKIIRNHAKIESTIHNARKLLKMHECEKSLGNQLWSLVNWIPINGSEVDQKELTIQSEHIFKMNGFKRVGPVTVRSFLQAAGIINDHELTCFRYKELLQLADKLMKGI